MTTQELVNDWFHKWTTGDFHNLPISDNFKHTSPFGTINGKKAYLDLVQKNKEKFLGHQFQVHDGLYEDDHACVRYTAKQGTGFSLDVSEWYYFKEGLIKEIIAYYHVGEIRVDRQLDHGEGE